ncbi:MAG: hypothetical protein IPM61_03590 [Chlorobi bacterium]|nr:hypothetical protein [Chlorobiota bacterium]MBX7217953.1 hypothetical protein [Candidatus Kapabacteria bacterium]
MLRDTLLALFCTGFFLFLFPGCESNPTPPPTPIDSSKLFQNIPPGSSKYLVRVVELNLNPKAPDTAEFFVLKNFGTTIVSLNDWLIVSHDGSYRLKLDEWQLLTGQLYRKISLFTDRPRETGDTLYLLDKDKGDTIQTIIYGPLPKGEPYRL